MWLFTDGDLLNKHESKRSNRLWCYTTKTKKGNTKKGAKEEQNKSEVDEKLQKRHNLGNIHPCAVACLVSYGTIKDSCLS